MQVSSLCSWLTQLWMNLRVQEIGWKVLEGREKEKDLFLQNGFFEWYLFCFIFFICNTLPSYSLEFPFLWLLYVRKAKTIISIHCRLFFKTTLQSNLVPHLRAQTFHSSWGSFFFSTNWSWLCIRCRVMPMKQCFWIACLRLQAVIIYGDLSLCLLP